jgi:hypothetical protein
MDRRTFLASAAVTVGMLSLPSIACATSPSLAFFGTKFIVLDYQAMTIDQDLWSVIPTRDDILSSLLDQLMSRIANAGANIQVAERPTYVNRPEGVTEAQTMHATVMLDLAHWELGNADVVGGALVHVFRQYPQGTVAQLVRPTAFFGAAARMESVREEFSKVVAGPLDKLVREITAYD